MKLIYLDLRETAGARLPSVAEAYTCTDGTLPILPLYIKISALTCNAELYDGALTWDALFAAKNTLGAGEVMFSDIYLARELYDTMLMDFIDAEAGEAHFDSEKFRERILFLSRMADMTDSSVGTISSFNTDYYMSHPSLRARLADGGLRFLTMSFKTIWSYPVLALVYGDAPINLCGNPGDGKAKAYLLPGMHLAVSQQTTNPDACDAFVKYLLSDVCQADAEMTKEMLPVSESGLRAAALQHKYLFYLKDDMEAIQNPSDYTGGEVYYEIDGILYTDSTAMGTLLSPWMTAPELSAALPTGYLAEDFEIVEYTDEQIDAFISFLSGVQLQKYSDSTILSIVNEELSYWQNTVRTIEETTKIIDSRVWIYLNE